MKKYNKAALDMVKAGIVTGVGASAVTAAGGNAAGLATMSSYYPMMGSAVGAGMALSAVKGLTPRKRRLR